MVSIAVIGGGVSGLTAAHRLRGLLGPEAAITVYERLPALGGKLSTTELAGQAYDIGAEAFLIRRPEARDLVTELGLADQLVSPRGLGARVRAGGRNRSLPPRTMMGVPSSLTGLAGILSPAGLAAVAGETEAGRLELSDDISVGGLVRPRLGDEVVDRLVDPLLGGVYAGHADRLSLRATMPALAAAIDRGATTLTSAAATTITTPPGTAPTEVFGALSGGMTCLVQALATGSRARVVTGTTVRGLTRTPTGWRLDVDGRHRTGGQRLSVEHDGVLLAVPAPAARRLLSDVSPTASSAFGAIEVASMAIVALALPGGTCLPDSTGVLIAEGERHADGSPFTAKAFTYSSRKWTHFDGVVVRASVGRHGDTTVLRRDDAELVHAVRRDLTELTGITAEPVESTVRRWGGGLPQYGVGHLDVIDRLRRAIGALPGLAVAGAAIDGVGIPACVSTATRAAHQVTRSLSVRT